MPACQYGIVRAHNTEFWSVILVLGLSGHSGYAIAQFSVSPGSLVNGRHLGLTGSVTTMMKVQIGPRNSEANHQFKPLRPLLCASPALMSDRVNHPTAYSPVFCVFMVSLEFPRPHKTKSFNFPQVERIGTALSYRGES